MFPAQEDILNSYLQKLDLYNEIKGCLGGSIPDFI
jgi:hypothetical protein